MESSGISAVCLTSQQLAKSALFRYGTLLKAILCPICIIIGVIYTKKKGLAWLGNPNTKVLFLFHIFWAIEVPATFAIAYAFDAIRYSLPTTDPCGYVIKAYIGFPLRALPGFGVGVQTMSMLSFSIERVIATAYPRFFEKRGSPAIGLFLVGAVMIFDVIFWGSRVVLNADFNDDLVLTTVWTKTNQNQNEGTVWTYFGIEIFTALVFTLTLQVNKYLNREYSKNSDRNINRKYQINENLRVMTALQPCFYLHCIMQAVQYIGVQMQKMVQPLTDLPPAVFIELVAFQPYLYILLVPLILHWFLKRQNRSVVDSHVVMEDHFEQIQLYFDEHFERQLAAKCKKKTKWQRFMEHVAIVSKRRR